MTQHPQLTKTRHQLDNNTLICIISQEPGIYAEGYIDECYGWVQYYMLPDFVRYQTDVLTNDETDLDAVKKSNESFYGDVVYVTLDELNQEQSLRIKNREIYDDEVSDYRKRGCDHLFMFWKSPNRLETTLSSYVQMRDNDFEYYPTIDDKVVVVLSQNDEDDPEWNFYCLLWDYHNLTFVSKTF